MDDEPASSKPRRWAWTYNNPSEFLCENGPTWTEWPNLRYAICQLECAPTTGTLHLQGYCEFTRPCRLAALQKLLPGLHGQVARGTESQNTAYCSKTEGALNGPWTFGEPSQGQGTRNDLKAVQAALDNGASVKDVAREHFGSFVRYSNSLYEYVRLQETGRTIPTELIVLVGPPGSGKSKLAHDLAGDGAHWNYGSWWDGYEGQRVVVLDDFNGWLPYTQLLRLADRYPFRVEVKGSVRNFTSRAIIITSNKMPNTWYDPEKHVLAALFRRISVFLYLDHEETSSYVQRVYP